MNHPNNQSREAEDFASRCLSIDLEVSVRDARIRAFAAVRGDTGQVFACHKRDLAKELARLDEFAEGADFLLGHNLIDFDAPHLAAANPRLRLLGLPAVDTLRLNPLAFPSNPYHHLVKHYQDGQLKRGRLNDPELDARLTLDLLRDQQRAFQAALASTPDLMLAWHWLVTSDGAGKGFDALFTCLRSSPRPARAEAMAAIRRFLSGRACSTHGERILGEEIPGEEILIDAGRRGWSLAYALAWLSVSGGNSVMPPWVRHQFPEAGSLVRRLRDTPCDDSACDWCRERHDASKELARWFGFSQFRPEPADENGRPLQQLIIEAAMRGEHVLGILPTGTGKSLCYQIPALSRFDKTGALTVVISPLVALMADQVANLEKRGISSCVSINGLLSMPERADALDRVRLGDAGILIVSPEQLRNRTLRNVLAQREIGAWVLDEAHCISKWGHDFRPDYRYVGRFIREKAAQGTAPPVMCLTATAKPDVIADISDYFRDKLGIELKVFDGGASRANLDFNVVPTTRAEKLAHIHQVLLAGLPLDSPGGAIVYCATRRGAEETADYLRAKELPAEHFHAGLPPETKKNVQERFIRGELRVIVATNAFGMGIDKPDVRMVIHADIPGSLENYLQEAGRAGRDQKEARCVLLYDTMDIERQFGMSARARLTRRQIQAILRSLRNLNRKKRLSGEVVATTGEILMEDSEGEFERDSATDDTRVRTAIAWLEEAALLSREENRVNVFPSSLRVSSVDEAQQKIAEAPINEQYKKELLSLTEALIGADADQGISTDELMAASGLNAERVCSALYNLEKLGIASNDTALTAFVHAGVKRSSLERLEEAEALERALIDELRQAAPDLGKGDSSHLNLRIATQRLKDAGHAQALPEKLWRIVKSLSSDGRGEDGGKGSLSLRRRDPEMVEIRLEREWEALSKTAALRRAAARRLLKHLLGCLPRGKHGTDLLAETTLGKLFSALEGDLFIKGEMKKPDKLLDRALLWLHEQEVIRLNKGLTVFRPAMTIRLAEDKRGFVKADFAPLQLHYDEQVAQIHVIAEYAQRGLQSMADALQLAMDYFTLKRDEFMRRWLPNREKELGIQTTRESWRAIVESLNNPAQQRIVADDREQTNLLVLAGPGSGKTRVLVHRIAYLVRVKREDPRGILALAYNRHAAVEIRRRLRELIGNDAKGVNVLTCHALAMRLAGVSFARRASKVDDDSFKAVLRQAVDLLKGTNLPPEEADEQRDRLLAGFRWILVDEYQDIGPEQYELISALSGRTLQDKERKLSLFAVGDDDQNIYAFSGASIEFIRRFKGDYEAKTEFLTENYRSSAHIIAAANAVISPARNRMKDGHQIKIDKARTKAPAGGEWESMDPISRGRVQVLTAGGGQIAQALAVMSELERLSVLDPSWRWEATAVIARDWKYLEPVRSYCELERIPVQMADEDELNLWRLRETKILIEWLRGEPNRLLDTAAINRWLDGQPSGPWWSLLRDAVAQYDLETNGAELPVSQFIDWLADWGREVRRRQTGLLLMTAHRAKGLEFDHVAVLDGSWGRVGPGEDRDAPRRLYYVAMTRARKTLILSQFNKHHALLRNLSGDPSLLFREQMQLPKPAPELARRYLRPTLRDVDLGFAGRYEASHSVHRAISRLTTGECLRLRDEEGRSELIDKKGRIVGRLARSFDPPAGMKCIAASVRAIIVRGREDSEPEYLDRVRCERWEVVVPELIYAPEEMYSNLKAC